MKKRIITGHGIYAYFKGTEYFARQTTGYSKEIALKKKKEELEKKKNPAFLFPLNVKIVKGKDGYYVFSNDTVHNYHVWKESGTLPKI